jgi:hypothetical protein
MEKDHKYYNEICNNPKFMSIRDKIPQAESLKTTMLRVIPFWNSAIVPDIKNGKRVLVVCHGTSLRGIMKHIDREYNLYYLYATVSHSKEMPLLCTSFVITLLPDGIKQYCLASNSVERITIGLHIEYQRSVPFSYARSLINITLSASYAYCKV